MYPVFPKMKCVLQVSMLSSLVEIIHGMVKRVNVYCTSEGIHLKCSTHDMYSSFVLDKDGFTSYECVHPVTFGLDVELLQKVLQQVDGWVSLETDGVLHVRSQTVLKKSSFELSLQDPTYQPSIPDIEYECVVHLPTSEFVQTCRGCCGECMEITVNDQIRFNSRDKQCSSSVTYDGVVRNMREMFMVFNTKYLSFAKGVRLSKRVVLSIALDYPLRVECGFPGGHMQLHVVPSVGPTISI